MDISTKLNDLITLEKSCAERIISDLGYLCIICSFPLKIRKMGNWLMDLAILLKLKKAEVHGPMTL